MHLPELVYQLSGRDVSGNLVNLIYKNVIAAQDSDLMSSDISVPADRLGVITHVAFTAFGTAAGPKVIYLKIYIVDESNKKIADVAVWQSSLLTSTTQVATLNLHQPVMLPQFFKLRAEVQFTTNDPNNAIEVGFFGFTMPPGGIYR